MLFCCPHPWHEHNQHQYQPLVVLQAVVIYPICMDCLQQTLVIHRQVLSLGAAQPVACYDTRMKD